MVIGWCSRVERARRDGIAAGVRIASKEGIATGIVGDAEHNVVAVPGEDAGEVEGGAVWGEGRDETGEGAGLSVTPLDSCSRRSPR